MTQPLSSGRWDASGSWEEAVEEQHRLACDWVWGLGLHDLRLAVMQMEYDTNAFTLYQRKAILMRVQEVIWQHENS